VAGKEIGLEVNADKTKYVVIPGDQNRSHNIKVGNGDCERVELFRYLGITTTNIRKILKAV
jgi:hypothetical protein